MPDRPAAFHRTGSGQLLVGAAEADITPAGDPYLGGFGLNRRATGVHSPLMARALVFVVGELKVAVVGVDNLGLQRGDVDWIKSGIPGFTNGNVFLCSSHTHAAPDLVGLWGFYFLTSGRDLDYLARVRRGVIDAVLAAERAARPAALRRGEARMPRQGLVKNSNRPGVFDRRLTVVQATAVDGGQPIGALLHLGCHPEVLRRSNTAVSADFVGALCDRWQAVGLGQAVFINGALGAMVTPFAGGEGGIAPAADGLLAVAQQALETARPVPLGDAEVRRRDVYLPMESSTLNLTRLTMVVPRELYGGSLRTTVGYLRLGELEACALPGETEPGLGASIRALAHRPDLLLFGLVDDEVGYLMKEKDARDPEFAYERSMSPGPRSGELCRRALVGR